MSATPSMPDHALPVGTEVGGFRITGLVGEGGFGIVYRAEDRVLHREVALKEYMPAALAVRADRTMQVRVSSTRSKEPFAAGLSGFLAEARLLARFDHPALIKVHRFWEANGTAYMAMPLLQGRTLQQIFDDSPEPQSEARIRAWLDPLLDAVQVLHAAGCVHRDITPDNIVITDAGPVLLDFGAARLVVADLQKSLTVMLKPGYAPVEQYGESATAHQGPWTDLYALGAVVATAITKQAPPSSVTRILDDRQELLWRSHADRYGRTFLHAIDTALAVRPEQRPQSVAQWRQLLNAPAPAMAGAAAPETGPAPIVRRTWTKPIVPVARLRALRRIAAILGGISLATILAQCRTTAITGVAPEAIEPASAVVTAAAPAPAAQMAVLAPPAALAPPARRAGTAAAGGDRPGASTPPPRRRVPADDGVRRVAMRTPTAECSAALQRASLETASMSDVGEIRDLCR